jgi:hypothetical protein
MYTPNKNFIVLLLLLGWEINPNPHPTLLLLTQDLLDDPGQEVCLEKVMVEL